MARRNRDLAGLAALGALGLYAARGGKKTDAEAAATPVEDRKAAAAPFGVGMLRGSVEEETAGTNLPRLNEYGEPYSLESAPARPASTPARPGATTNRSMAGSRNMPSADEDFPPVKTRRRNVAGDYTRTMGARPSAAEIDSQMQALARGREREPDYVSRRKPNVIYDAQGNEVRPFKKGGAVKKMASGGMTASNRADGIASRGKTKCKMY